MQNFINNTVLPFYRSVYFVYLLLVLLGIETLFLIVGRGGILTVLLILFYTWLLFNHEMSKDRMAELVVDVKAWLKRTFG
jgi:hypothetical protein